MASTGLFLRSEHIQNYQNEHPIFQRAWQVNAQWPLVSFFLVKRTFACSLLLSPFIYPPPPEQCPPHSTSALPAWSVRDKQRIRCLHASDAQESRMSFITPLPMLPLLMRKIGGLGVMAAAYGAHGLEKRVNGDAGKLKVTELTIVRVP